MLDSAWAWDHRALLTIAWMRIVHAMMVAHAPAEKGKSLTVAAFLEQHTRLHSTRLHSTRLHSTRLYYTRERIVSDAARRGWVEPELALLPVARG